MQRALHRWWLCLGLAASLTAVPAAASVEGEVAFHRGVVAFDEGRLDQARREFEAVLARDPEDREALRYLAEILGAQGDPASALRLLERVVALDPGDRELCVDRARVLLELGRDAEAREALSRVLEEDPGDAQAQLYAGIAAYRARDLAAASAHLRCAAELEPSLAARSRYYSGLVAAAQGDLHAAERAFAGVARRSPVSPLGRSAAGLSGALRQARAWSVEVGAVEEWRGPWSLEGGGDEPERLPPPALPPSAALARNGERHRFGLSQRLALPLPFRDLTLGAVGDVLDSVGTEARYAGFETALGAGYDFPYALSFSWLWRFAHRDYRGASAFEPFAGRVDDTHLLTAELARPLVDRWIARLSGSFAFQDSNLSAYDQERRSVGAYLTYEW